MGHLLYSIAGLSLITTLIGCSQPHRDPDLALIYNDAAQNIGDDRNPVIVIPGILGSKLEDSQSGQSVWGAFTYGSVDADKPEGARLFALPMQEGVYLTDLKDTVVPTEVLDTLTLDIGLIRGLELSAYVDILKTLAAGKYRDSMLGDSGAVDYGGLHYTCFQYGYDWRRDIAEQAAELHKMIIRAVAFQPNGGTHVDVVAHSMGGLVLRYYLRYGPDPLPADGSLPELDWEGTKYIQNAILVGTPSAGSVMSFTQLIEGVNFASLITPTYQPAVLGTMPSIYQLLPRARHQRVINAETGEPIDIFDVENWVKYGWGLADPDQKKYLRQLMPDVESDEARRRIAIDHLDKSLKQADQFFRAIDVPAQIPDDTTMHIVLGDALETADVVSVNPNTGKVKITGYAPGDNTVTRASALMDERVGSDYIPRLQSPASFESYLFLSEEHIGLTRDPAFVNYLLFTLLERPREKPEINKETQ
jgi:pimeloyl-ACP methyl ester carboxylesterase